MAAMACTLANAVDKSLSRHTAREKEYAECIKRLGGVEKPAKCFAIVIEALKAFTCENIAMNFSGPKMPAVVEAEDSDMKAIVLPVMIREE